MHITIKSVVFPLKFYHSLHVMKLLLHEGLGSAGVLCTVTHGPSTV